MKNLLRVLLLVLCCCLVFTACDFGNKKPSDEPQKQEDKFTKESVEADPIGAILKAMGNTASYFMTDDAQINETINAAMLNGSFGVDLNNAMLLDEMSMSDAQLEIHSRESGEAVFAVKGEMTNGQKIDSYIYITKDKMAVGSELFETIDMDPAYSLTYSDLENEEWINDLAGLFSEYAGNDQTTMDQVMKQVMEQVFGQMEDMMENAGQGMDTKWLKDAVNGLKPTVTEKDGVIIVSYVITIDKLIDMAEDIVDNMPDDLLEMFTMSMAVEGTDVSMDVDDIRDMIEEGIDYLDDLVSQSGVDANITLEVGLNIETSRLASMSLKGNVKVNSKKMVDLDLSTTYTDNAVKTEIDADLGGVGIEGSIDFEKESTDSKVEYALTLDVEVDSGYGSAMEVGGELTYTYEKNGDFAVELEIAMPYNNNQSFKLEGKVTKADQKVTISIDEISGSALQGIALDDLGAIWFDAGSTLPAFPTDATNVKDMTLDEIEALMKKAGMTKPLYGTYTVTRTDGTEIEYNFYGSSYSKYTGTPNEYGYMNYDHESGKIAALEDDFITLEYSEWEYDEDSWTSYEVFHTNTYTFKKGDGYIRIDGVTYTEVVDDEYDY